MVSLKKEEVVFKRLSVNQDGDVLVDGVPIAMSDGDIKLLAEVLRKEYADALAFPPGMSLAERTRAAYAAFEINDMITSVLGMSSGRKLRQHTDQRGDGNRRLKMPSGY